MVTYMERPKSLDS